MIRKKIIAGVCVLLSLFLVECKKKKETISPDSSFDKAGMLSNFAENLIIPAYADLKNSVDSLYIMDTAFVNTPTLFNLTNLQAYFLKTYTRFQTVSTYEFGPADLELFRANLNTFPCDTLQINTKIAAGDFSLSAAADIDAKGLPAIDFLLYGSSHDPNTALLRFTTGVDAANAKQYLHALVNEIKTKTAAISTGWSTSGGGYINTFISNTSSSVGSSIGMLVNQFSFDLEILKNAQIGIPAGKKSLGTPFPDKTEAHYSTKSLLLAAEHLKALENIYLGRNAQGVDGIGFDDYLEHLGSMYGSELLNTAIKNKFTSAKAKLALVAETLSQSVISDPTAVDAAYNELQQLVVLIKVDMTSALGVMITYQDNDGD